MQGCGGAVSSGLGRVKLVWRGGICDVSRARLEIEDLLTECVAAWGSADFFADDSPGISTFLVMFLVFTGEFGLRLGSLCTSRNLSYSHEIVTNKS